MVENKICLYIPYYILSTFEETLSSLQQLPLYVLAGPLTICATERLATEFSFSSRQIPIRAVAYPLVFFPVKQGSVVLLSLLTHWNPLRKTVGVRKIPINRKVMVEFWNA